MALPWGNFGPDEDRWMELSNGRVWTLAIRLSHWIVALAFLAAVVTAGRPMALHVKAGGLVLLYAVVRTVLALRGPESYRFDPEMLSPRAWVAELRGLVTLKPLDHPRHGPIGSLILLLLLASLAFAAATGSVAGLARYGVVGIWGGTAPASDSVSLRTDSVASDPAVGGTTVISRVPAQAEDAARPVSVPDAVSAFHGTATDVALVILGIHVVWSIGVGAVRRENRLLSMFTGYRHSSMGPPPRPAFASAPIAAGSAAGEPRPRMVSYDPKAEKERARAEKNAQRERLREEKQRARDEKRSAKLGDDDGEDPADSEEFDRPALPQPGRREPA